MSRTFTIFEAQDRTVTELFRYVVEAETEAVEGAVTVAEYRRAFYDHLGRVYGGCPHGDSVLAGVCRALLNMAGYGWTIRSMA